MKQIILLITACTTLLMVQCTNEDFPLVPEGSTPFEWAVNQVKVIEADNTFGFKLLQKIEETEGNENLFTSPFSIAMALGMTMNGAVGDTQNEMKTVLEKNDLDIETINESYQALLTRLPQLDENVTIHLANSIWYDPVNLAINENFENDCTTYFDSEINELNFQDPAAVDIINAWIEGETNGHIEDMLDQVPGNALMYLINAIYFQADWKYTFEEENTQTADFFLEDGTNTSCDMMQMTADLPYFSNEYFQAVDLAYSNDVFSMTILLPNEDKTVGEVVDVLTNDNWKIWMQNFETTNSLSLKMPRFTVKYKNELKETLKSMGMEIPFDPYSADFSNLGTLPGNAANIDRVIHQSFVEVNEQGTEAAAATIVEIVFNTGSIDTAPTMNLNRPFVFVIREKQTNSILFTGTLMNPEG